MFWLFLAQVLSAERACREVVRKFLGLLALEDQSASPGTAGYCKGRARLRQKDLDDICLRLARKVEQSHPGSGRWLGRAVKVIDGSALSMPDTPDNQKLYPQPKAVKPGCGFPIMRMVALFSLSTGIMIALAKGALKLDERSLFRSLWDLLDPGDVVLADRGFGSYADFYLLRERGVDCVMRGLKRRTVKSLVKRLGCNDHLCHWHKSKLVPAWLGQAAWAALPETLLVREIAFNINIPGFRTKAVTVATTLLDPRQFPAPAFADLYRRRWNVELFLRDIKTTMGMDVLRCKTPAMVHKELTMYQIAYNLVRLLMLQAAGDHRAPLERVSFKGTIATIRQWAPLLAGVISDDARVRLTQSLLQYLAKDLTPARPNRNEPRARKRRPKNYQLLTTPRRLFKETPHRNRSQKVLS